MKNLSIGIKDSKPPNIFILLLFCLPHKKVTKKVTTANTMLYNIDISNQGRGRMVHTAVDGHPPMPFAGAIFGRA